MAAALTSEVKGLFFLTARQHLLAAAAGTLDAVVGSMPSEHRAAMAAPRPSAWYPEAALHEAFHAVHRHACAGDDRQFERFIDECTRAGTRRFLRSLLRLASPELLLRSFPLVMRQLRRGGSRLEVVLDPARRGAVVRYRELPFSDDPLYHAALGGAFHASFALMGRSGPEVELLRAAPTSFELRLSWR